MLRIVAFIWSIITDKVLASIDRKETTNFSAEFGKEQDIASRWNRGLLISRHRRLTRKRSFQNLLLVGVTGAGKTTRLLIKNLFCLKRCTIVINDPSKELFNLTSGYLSKFFRILTLNFSDSSVSCGYNILSRIKKANDINKIAHQLVSSSIEKNSSDPFWSLQTKALLQILIRLVLHQPEEYRNMANVLHILHSLAANPTKVDEWIVKTGNKKLILDYKSLIATPEKTLQNIIASAKSALQMFEDEELAKVTSHDSIQFEQLRKKPTVLFLHTSISEQKYVSVVQGIFFDQFYGYLTQELPHKKDLNVYIILEEASSLYIPILPLALANTRKARVSNVISVQSTNQLDTFYKGDAENIVSNCITKIYLPGITSMNTLKEIETLSGKSYYNDNKGSQRTKQLISVDEIRQLPDNRSLILCANFPLIMGRTSPYYRSYLKYRLYAAKRPLPLKGDIPDAPLPLIS